MSNKSNITIAGCRIFFPKVNKFAKPIQKLFKLVLVVIALHICIQVNNEKFNWAGILERRCCCLSNSNISSTSFHWRRWMENLVMHIWNWCGHIIEIKRINFSFFSETLKRAYDLQANKGTIFFQAHWKTRFQFRISAWKIWWLSHQVCVSVCIFIKWHIFGASAWCRFIFFLRVTQQYLFVQFRWCRFIIIDWSYRIALLLKMLKWTEASGEDPEKLVVHLYVVQHCRHQRIFAVSLRRAHRYRIDNKKI